MKKRQSGNSLEVDICNIIKSMDCEEKDRFRYFASRKRLEKKKVTCYQLLFDEWDSALDANSQPRDGELKNRLEKTFRNNKAKIETDDFEHWYENTKKAAIKQLEDFISVEWEKQFLKKRDWISKAENKIKIAKALYRKKLFEQSYAKLNEASAIVRRNKSHRDQLDPSALSLDIVNLLFYLDNHIDVTYTDELESLKLLNSILVGVMNSESIPVDDTLIPPLMFKLFNCAKEQEKDIEHCNRIRRRLLESSNESVKHRSHAEISLSFMYSLAYFDGAVNTIQNGPYHAFIDETLNVDATAEERISTLGFLAESYTNLAPLNLLRKMSHGEVLIESMPVPTKKIAFKVSLQSAIVELYSGNFQAGYEILSKLITEYPTEAKKLDLSVLIAIALLRIDNIKPNVLKKLHLPNEKSNLVVFEHIQSFLTEFPSDYKPIDSLKIALNDFLGDKHINLKDAVSTYVYFWRSNR